MKVIYHDSVKQDKEAYPLLQRATAELPGIIQRSAEAVTVEWDRSCDERGRPAYAIHVSDEFGGESSGSFTPDELISAKHMQDRLHWLWGYVLRDRSHKQLAKLLETTTSAEN